MMDAADWDSVLVTDLAVERARLSKADVVRFGRRAAADDARLRGDEFAVLLVTSANGLHWGSTTLDNGRFRGGFESIEGLALHRVRLVARKGNCLRRSSFHLSALDRGEPLPEAGFDSFRVCDVQGVLCWEVLVNPVAHRDPLLLSRLPESGP
jgi:hypothetical protein